MELRNISTSHDLELAFKTINQKTYPLSFYEFALKHDQDYEKSNPHKLIGVFENSECIGMISYKISFCEYLDRVLEINEIHHSNIKAYKKLMDYLDSLAKKENCAAIKINKNKPTKLNVNVFDKVEIFLKNLIH